MKQSTLQANGLEFTLIQIGSGPNLGLFVHGFPDDAGSMIPLMERFANTGFTCYAPYLRGYSDGSIPPAVKEENKKTVSIFELADDLRSILLKLHEERQWKQTLLLGHDWGSIAAYGLANLSPNSISVLAALSVPPLPIFLRNLLMHPAQLLRSWYILFFQLRFGIPERAILKPNGGLLRKFWRDWSPGWNFPEDRFQEVLQTLKDPIRLRTALGYYRGLITPESLKDWNRSRRLLFRKIQVPSILLSGNKDRCIHPSSFSGLDSAFSAPFQFFKIQKAGHFLPLEAPDQVFTLVNSFWIHRTNDLVQVGKKP
ncbi:alpha/beta hydrolase family protein [Leptospira broomii serovar Hurstbridge str. 5399]|uniref:Alpha/beta hydrolase family protein n=1 Tax=Leptospira broomii serovar Hurstbridge str. 5399 TaxID=1049789 RepID=T0EXX9_9LEPT|nr:alpha/beta hydrolase [Leptospira broomii]EQA43675.1 alpha/beta hydrolase family protein [Leptospira broomii serovar Hurstbridge str. 5399]